MVSEQRVTVGVGEDGVGRLTLAGAERQNAIDARFVDELAAAVAALGAVDGLRAVLVRAEGRSFSVGGDLRFFAGYPEGVQAGLAATVPAYQQILADLAHLPAPVVAAVQGPCAGGGLGIAWGADLVVAAEDAVFATGFHKLGLSGDGGSSWWLPRLVGHRRAQQMLIGGRVVDAATALDWGLVTEVVPRGELAGRTEALAAQLAAGPTAGLAAIRGLLQGSATATLREQLAAETQAILATGATADATEGITAFAAKRPPAFRGDGA